MGKTTLLALLLGFARPLSGELSVDGHALDDLTLAARRGLFAVVPQHAALFGGAHSSTESSFAALAISVWYFNKM